MPLKKLTTNTILKKKKNLSQHAEKKKCYLPNVWHIYFEPNRDRVWLYPVQISFCFHLVTTSECCLEGREEMNEYMQYPDM